MPGPIVPPPPGLFSMTNGWPSCRETWSSTTRATVSLALPAVNGLMTCIARVGQASPSAAAAAATSATPAMAMALHKPRREIIRTSLGCADRRRAVIHYSIRAIRSDANGGGRIITKAPKDATAFLSVAELLARYRRKDLSPVEMVDAVLDRVDRHNGVVNAYCWLDREGARRNAREAEARWMAGAPRGLIDGIKPTRARVSAWPASPLGTLAHVGCLTRSVADAALALTIIAAPDLRDVYAWTSPAPDFGTGLEDGVAGMRVAYSPRLAYAERVDAEVETAVTAAVRVFEELGAHVDDADPELDGDPIAAWDTLWWSSFAGLLQSHGERVRDLADPGLVAAAARGRETSAMDYIRAQLKRAELPAVFARFFQRPHLLPA